MYYRDLAGIANDLTRTNLTLQTILQTFSMRRFADRKFLASSFLQVTQDGILQVEGFYGANLDEFDLAANGISVFSDHPAAECIRNDSIVCTEPKANGHPAITIAFIAWPVYRESRTIGALVAMTDKGCDDSSESHECLESLSLLVNSALVRVLRERIPQDSLGRSNGKAHSHIVQSHLTERQEVILRLISEGRTNADIAQLLGYSESLIRQETIRIYAHLGCDGRQEAALIYRSRVAAVK
jgi:DNA-binding CsgD family transcriptional regulator